MKKENMEIAIVGLFIITLILGFFITFDYEEDNKLRQEVENLEIDLGQYDYCVEWDEWIDRMTILYQCGIQKEPPLECDFDIKDNNDLEITIYNKSKDISEMVISQQDYECTRLIKSIHKGAS